MNKYKVVLKNGKNFTVNADLYENRDGSYDFSKYGPPAEQVASFPHAEVSAVLNEADAQAQGPSVRPSIISG